MTFALALPGNARAKVIENVLGRLQNQTERDLGYIGRDQRHDRFERIEKQVQQVRSGKVDPREFLMEKQELAARLDEIVHNYNHEPHAADAKILQGRSPWQGYQEFFGDVALKRFDASTRYVLAGYKKTVRVGPNGISFKWGKERYTYKSENTGRLQGRKVEAYFSPDQPDFLCVTVPELSDEVPFIVERAVNPPAYDPGSPLLAEALRQNAAHESYGNRLFRSVRMDFPEDFRRRMVTQMETSESEERLGANMAVLRAEAGARTEQEAHEANSKAAAVRALGVAVSPFANRRADQMQAAPELKKWLADAKRATASGETTTLEAV